MFDTDEEAIIAQNIIEEVLGSVFDFFTPIIKTTIHMKISLSYSIFDIKCTTNICT